MCKSVCVRSFSLILWLELIGFDNTLSDFGVEKYLSQMERKPDAISILIDNDRLFRSYGGGIDEFSLPADCCSYRARPYNSERRRQDWTSSQLKELVTALKDKGVEVYVSFFNRSDALPTDDANMRDISSRLANFLADFGFTGLHGADGYAPPKYLLPECTDAERVSVARKAADRYAVNMHTLVGALRQKGLKILLNTCWTRDPYEALYRYGVDYRLLAKTGIDGLVVESSAAAQELEGWNYTKASALDKSTAMLMRLKASVPDVPLVLLHGINDGTEQWSALRHSPSATRSEALTLGTLFYNGRRAIDGYLACLADGIRAEEWKELDKTWSLSFMKAEVSEGVHLVWSDRAFDREFETCVTNRDANSNTLLYELLRQGLIIHSSVSVDYALAHENLPLLILNPEFFPADELADLNRRRARVYQFGRGARSPFDGEPYVSCLDSAPFPGMPGNMTCYWKKPIPENLPAEAAVRNAARLMNWLTSPYECRSQCVKSWSFRLPNGRLGIFARNDADVYATAAFSMHNCISDVCVHTDFPSLPVQTVLETRIAPRDTVFFSVRESEPALPDPVRMKVLER